jgi:hypothetical protein
MSAFASVTLGEIPGWKGWWIDDPWIHQNPDQWLRGRVVWRRLDRRWGAKASQGRGRRELTHGRGLSWSACRQAV